MDIDEIIDFIYPRNPAWEKMGASREAMKVYLSKPQFNFVVIRQNKEIVTVGIYLKDKIHLHFLSVTSVKGNTIRAGLRHAIKKEKPKFVSWLMPDYRLFTKECEV